MKKKIQQWTQPNDQIWGNDFFGENNNYHQVGNGYFEFEKTLWKYGKNFGNLDGNGNVDEPIRLVISESASSFSIATLSTRGDNLVQNNNVGLFPTILKILTSKCVDLKSKIGKIKESQNGIKGSSLNKTLIDNHEKEVNRRESKKLLTHRTYFRILQKLSKESQKL